jgi:hypothetical protein
MWLCPVYRPGPTNFTVIHTNGLHRVRLDFCDCEDEPVSRWRQLFRLRWWPATVLDPHTAVTFDCLRQFEKVNAFGHVNATDYYRALRHMVDPSGLDKAPVSYWLLPFMYITDSCRQDRERQFMLVTREWLHFKNLRRSGRFLKVGGAESTEPGELAVLCCSCPIDGVNMVKDWRLCPDNKQ